MLTDTHPTPKPQDCAEAPLSSNFININAYCDYKLHDQQTRDPLGVVELSRVFSPSMAQVELCRDPLIPIPSEVRQVYARFRPTRLFRCENFEKAIGTGCEIYVKNEGTTPSGNHKANSAAYIAHLCKVDGIKTLTTETTGNWGLALAQAAKECDIELVCFMDVESNRKRPERKLSMERLGTKVVVVEHDQYHGDLLTLSADAAIRYTRELPGAVYIFGSIYGYFVLPQTMIGAEAKQQLSRLDRYPDVVVGSCGGGANLLGTAAAFLVDRLTEGRAVEFIAAESEHCPIVSKGRRDFYSIDTLNYYPMLDTYGLEGLGDSEYIGGLGSTILSSAVADFHRQGLIVPKTYRSDQARAAAALFHQTEGMWVALETGYQLAAVVEAAQSRRRGIILVNVSAAAGDQTIYAPEAASQDEPR